MNRFVSVVLSFLLMIYSSSGFSQSLDFEWVRLFENAQSLSVSTDAYGNVYNTGLLFDSVDFDPGPDTHFLWPDSAGDVSTYCLKLDNTGNLVWVTKIQGTNPPNSAASDTYGNVHLATFLDGPLGEEPDTVMFTKLDSDGNLLWSTKHETYYFSIAGIGIDTVGNMFVGGEFGGFFEFGQSTLYSNQGRGFIIKIGSNGNLLWAKNFGTTGSSSSNDFKCDAMATDLGGNVVLCGSFEGTGDFDPTGFSNNLTSDNNSDMFVMKIDPSANLLWVNHVAGPGTGSITTVSTDVIGDIIFCGAFRGAIDFDSNSGSAVLDASDNTGDMFVCKLNQSGVFLWVRQIGGASSAEVIPYSSGVDNTGNIYVGGSNVGHTYFDLLNQNFSLTSSGFYLPFISALNPQGVFEIVGAFEGYHNSWAPAVRSMSVNASGELFATDYISISQLDTVDFDFGPGISLVNPTSSISGYVLKLNNGMSSGIHSPKRSQALNVFPNPAKSEITVSLGSDDECLSRFYAINSTGQIICEELPLKKMKSIVIDTGDWIDGFYLISAEDCQGYRYSERLVVCH